MKRKISIIAALMLAISLVFTCTAMASPKAEEAFAQTSKAAIMLDADSGMVVFEKNTTERLPIASMVKIMTLCVAFDEISAREIPFTDKVTASQNAASMGGSQAFLDANSTYSLDELLKSIVVASANDSCVAVAEHLCGSVDAYVQKMNELAQSLGMTDTKFANCTGLPGGEQYCCAKDVATMFKKLIQNPKFFEYAGVWMYDFKHPSGRVTGLTNTNKLVRFYEGCDGGKTGYTDAARSCVTVTAKRGDTRLICAVIGAENSKTRNKEVSELLNYGFSNYKTKRVLSAGDKLGDFAVNGGKQDSVAVEAKTGATVFVKSSDKCEVTTNVEIGEITAPVKAGDVVGSVTILVNGEKHSTVEAVASADCNKKGYLDIVDDFIEKW